MAPDDVEARNRADLGSFYRDGDTDALGRLFDRTAPRLMLLASHLVRDAHAAEELVQNTFVSVMEAGHTYDSSRPVMPWMSKILSNHAVDMHRARTRDRHVATDQEHSLPGPDADPADSTAIREAITAVHDAIESIPETYRQILTDKLVHGLRAVEIAKASGASADTVRSQLRRGLNLLRERLPKSLAVPAVAVALSRESLAAVRTRVLARASTTVVASTTAWTRWIFGGAAVVLVALAAWAVTASLGDPATEPMTAERPPAPERANVPVPAARRDAVVDPPPRPTKPAVRWRVVYEDTGEPARGVRVVAFRAGAATDAEPPTPLVTDQDGAVGVSALAPGTYWLGRGNEHQTLARTGASATLSIPKPFELRGTVVDEKDQPVSDAEIWLSRTQAGRRGSVVTRSDASGRFHVPDAPPRLRVMARTPTYAWSPRYQIFRPADGEGRLRIRLGPASRRVFGIVTDPAGLPRSGVTIHVELEPRGPSTVGPRVGPPAPLFAKSDARGEFAIEGLRDGTYRVFAGFGTEVDGLGMMFGRIELAGEDRRSDIALRKGWTAHGVVRNPRGEPVPGAVVTVNPQILVFLRRTKTDTEGRYRLGGLSAGTLILEAEVPGHGKALAEVQGRLGEHREIDLTADRGRWIRGRLVDETGIALRDWLVHLPKVRASQVITDAEGRFELTNLPGDPRDTKLTLWACRAVFGPPYAWTEVTEGDIGDLVVQAANAPTARLVGHVLTAKGTPPVDAMVSLSAASGHIKEQIVDPDTGRYEIRGFPPGEAALVLLTKTQVNRIGSRTLRAGGTEDAGTFTMPAEQQLLLRVEAPEGAAPPRLALVDVRRGLYPKFRRTKAGFAASVTPGPHVVLGFSADLIQQYLPITIEPGADVERTLRFEKGTRVDLEFRVREHPEWIEIHATDAAGKTCFRRGVRRPLKDFAFALAPGEYTVEQRFATGERHEQKLVVGAESLRITVPPTK